MFNRAFLMVVYAVAALVGTVQAQMVPDALSAAGPGTVIRVADGCRTDSAGRYGCEPVHDLTQGMPYATIQESIVAASAGDVIEVSPGTYHERINLLGKAITLRSSGGPDVTVIDADYVGAVITCTSGEGPGTLIEGFTVAHGTGTLYHDGPPPRMCGGGMYNRNSSPTLINCIFTENYASYEGGGMYNNCGNPSLTNCIFSGNSVVYCGGGMFSGLDSSPTLTNCIFSGNSGGYGGGTYNELSSSATLTNCTLSGNHADYNGGGLYSNSASATLTNCIFWGNTASSSGAQIDWSGEFEVSATYSCIQGGWPGTGNIDADPLFVDAGGGDFRLAPGSPCIDAGDPAFAPTPGELDLDGHSRVWDGDGDGLARVDVGAYEFGSHTYGDLNCDGLVNAFDLDPFVLALTDLTGYATAFPECEYMLADVNADGLVNAFDIDPFVLLLTGG